MSAPSPRVGAEPPSSRVSLERIHERQTYWSAEGPVMRGVAAGRSACAARNDWRRGARSAPPTL